MEKNIFIEKPVDVVFKFVTDMHKLKSWLPLKDVQPLNGENVRVGATFAQKFEFMGQQFDVTTEITQFDPPHAFAFKMLQGPPCLLTNSITFDAMDSGTNVVMVGEAELSGALKLMGPVMTVAVGKQLDAQLYKLKQVLEAEQYK
jgi:uncharacterized protein YndB with AHSA1/START domain